MATRKELQKQYLETPLNGGIFKITNTVNGRFLLGSTANLHGPLNRHRFMLSIGSHPLKAMQADWDASPEGTFLFEIVESFEHKPYDPAFNLEDELSLLEEIWAEKCDPTSAASYNLGGYLRQ